MHNSLSTNNLQRHLKSHSEEVDAHSFFNLLTSQGLFSTLEELQPDLK